MQILREMASQAPEEPGKDRVALPCYSRNPYNPYPSGDTLSYGLWEVMGLERFSALLAPGYVPMSRRQMGASSSQSQVALGIRSA